MPYVIGCDMHKKYSVFAAIDPDGGKLPVVRVNHDSRENFTNYLDQFPAGTAVAVETMGQWYWLVDYLEELGFDPKLTHAYKAKVMMGNTNKTDKLDATGLATLLRNGTLPEVWIPPAEVRDRRELLRWRMEFVKNRTRLKNRVHATLAKYAITTEAQNIFCQRGRRQLAAAMEQLPPFTRCCLQEHLGLLDALEGHVEKIETQIDGLFAETPAMQLLKSLPGIGRILSSVIAVEVGDIKRFPRAEQFCSYAGTTPKVSSSGGKTFYGRTRRDVNKYLKSAYVEAANCIVLQKKKREGSYVVRRYEMLKKQKGHGKAIMALARHLAEATWWMLQKNEPYKEPKLQQTVSSKVSQARVM